MKAWPVFVVAGLILVAGAVLASRGGEPAFPHETHERLFPLCEGCHIGVVTGRADQLFPEPASCAQCHDGEREDRVDWDPPGPRASNLRFFHPDHRESVTAAGETADCATCHVPDAGPTRMTVTAARPEGCLDCHAHAAETHLAVSAECAVCHRPLPEAPRIPVERVALFPIPPSHDEPDFLSTHAPTGETELFSCAACHARQTCERCHVNADRLQEIVALSPDPRIALLETGRTAEYPLPESHRDPDWSWAHGAAARTEPARCANCHARPSCTSCHMDGAGRVAAIQSLPVPAPGRAPGVDPLSVAAQVHPPDFERRHGSWAASGSAQCTDCHSRQYCSDCHAGADSRDFHPLNFMERHALEVFAGGADCQSCHNQQTFCRDCHVGAGIAAGGGRDVAFHTAQPLWILSHGQAARIGMDSCVACHRQADCLACHSSATGWGVNPHGPGFDAGRIAARNRATCRWCHIGDPIGGD